jgi:isocitrate dehydrogenase
LTETFCVDVSRCRLKLPDSPKGTASRSIPHRAVIALLDRIEQARLDFLQMELLDNFDGQPGFSRGQGQ